MACSVRCTFVVFCILQLVATVERQIFDLFGFLWAPVCGNFLQILLVIVGLVGACRYLCKMLVIYAIWNLVWIAWNAFVISYYNEVGFLNRSIPIMAAGGQGENWWLTNQISCRSLLTSSKPATEEYLSTSAPSTADFYDVATSLIDNSNEVSTLLPSPSITTFYVNKEISDPTLPFEYVTTEPRHQDTSAKANEITPGVIKDVTGDATKNPAPMGMSNAGVITNRSGCLLPYYYIESIHAGVQCLLSLICFILACVLAHICSEEEDSSCLEFDFIAGSLLPSATSTSEKKTETKRYQLKARYV